MLQKFGNYRIIEELCSREFRATYIAYPLAGTRQNVVLKVFDRACTNPSVGREQSFSLMNELAALQHPALLPIEDIVLTQENLYVVTPYLAQGSLASYLKTLPEHLDWRDALQIIMDIGYGLSYAHKQHILHGNLKPENILYSDDRALQITDFTLAPTIDNMKFNDPSDVQAARYKAPEQFADNLHMTSDQYALACLAYELISGQPPFDGDSMAVLRSKHFSEYPVPLTALVPTVPLAVETALSKALGKDRKKRYPDIPTFLQELNVSIARADTTMVAPSTFRTTTPDKGPDNVVVGQIASSPKDMLTPNLPEDAFYELQEIHRALNSFATPAIPPSISFNTHEEPDDSSVSGPLDSEKETERPPSGPLSLDGSANFPLEPFPGPLHASASSLKPFQDLPVDPFPGLLSSDTLFGNPFENPPKNAIPMRSLDPFEELLSSTSSSHKDGQEERTQGFIQEPARKPSLDLASATPPQRSPSSPLPAPGPLSNKTKDRQLEPDEAIHEALTGYLPKIVPDHEKQIQSSLAEIDTLSMSPVTTNASTDPVAHETIINTSQHAIQHMNDSTSVQPLITPAPTQNLIQASGILKPKVYNNTRQIWILLGTIIIILIILTVVPLTYLFSTQAQKTAKTNTTTPSSALIATPLPQIIATYKAIPTSVATATPPSASTPETIATAQATKTGVQIKPTMIVADVPQSTPAAKSTSKQNQSGITSLSINSGGGGAGSFVGDKDVSGGNTCNGTNDPITTSGVSDPAPQAVYQTNRCGTSMTYKISGLRANATYTVILHFAETYWRKAGARVFNVNINNIAVLVNFDIFATAGTDNAVVEQFTASSGSNSTITIAFTTVTDNALISGIEVILAS